MKRHFSSLKFTKNAVLTLAIILAFFPAGNLSAAGKKYYFYSAGTRLNHRTYSSYLNALKPFQKGFDESLKPGVTLKTLAATTLLKPHLTFDDLENLFKKKFYANPICFSQGPPGPAVPGRVFWTPLCWDVPYDGCYSCACQCGYVGFMWDPTTGLCGCNL